MLSKDLLSALNMVSIISWSMIYNVGAGILLGKLIDEYFGIGPWATIVGIVLGMMAGMWAIYKIVVGGK